MRPGLAIAAIAALFLTPALAQDALTLPGGASALSETHGDWTVKCAVELSANKIGCALSQQQADKATQQRVLAIELLPAAGDLLGTLALPFGLLLDKGVTLSLDDAAPLPLQRFRSCYPDGCHVALDLSPDVVTQLRHGAALKIKAVTDAGEDAPFSVSLKGFGGALDRTIDLAK